MIPCTTLLSEQMQWQPHPVVAGARIAYLLRAEAGLSCALVELPAGVEAEPHIHPESDDLLYILRGQGAMWVEGQGEIPLTPGCFLRIPSQLWHGPTRITETLLIHNTWLPRPR